MSKWWMIGAVGTFSVIVVVLIVFFVTHHEEPTLMQVCWENDLVIWIEGAPEEENRGHCKEPEPFIWPQDQLPITVAAAPAPDGQEVVGDPDTTIRDAVDLLNAQLGYNHLQALPTTSSETDITVEWGAAFVSGPGTTVADRAAGTCSFQGRTYVLRHQRRFK
jgi:hypothetical protein